MSRTNVCRGLFSSVTSWLCLAALSSAQTPAGEAYSAWLKYGTALKQDGSLVRLYTFEKPRDNRAPGQQAIPNLKGPEAPLTRGLVQAADAAASPSLTRIAGRWPQKQAVHLDRDFLAGAAPPMTGNSFTVAGWFRVAGLGAFRGDSVPTGGTLLSVGSGYFDGWRVTLNYPDRRLGFEIGRQPSSFGISGGSVAENVWHHIAANWDGRHLRLYLNGVLVAAGEYAGNYLPPAQGGQFRIGYAGSGWGALLLDVDEVTVYDRALTPAQILQAAHFQVPCSELLAKGWTAAQQAAEAKDYTAAAKQYAALAAEAELPPDLRAAARLSLARLAAMQNNASAAGAELGRVFESPGIAAQHRATALTCLVPLLREAAPRLGPGTLRSLLTLPELKPRDVVLTRLQLAGRLRDEGDLPAARAEYAQLVAAAGPTPREKLDAGLELAHTALAAKDFAAARTVYGQILRSPAAPAHYKSQAQLQLGFSHVQEANWAAARIEYKKLEQLPDSPAHHRWEAQECLREIDRLEAGLPARDPARWRVHLPARPAAGLTLYVAPDGTDSNPGTKEKPWATLEHARDRIRELKRQGGLPRGGVSVCLRDGVYPRTQTFQLTAEDSGTAEQPIVYRGCPGESPRLTAGVRLSGFRPVQDPAILARLPEAARGRVQQVDLRAAGISNFGRLVSRGFGRGAAPVFEVFCDGQPLRPARWPNEGWLDVGQVIQAAPGGNVKGFVFRYEGDRPQRWQQARDVFVYGYWNWHWADNALPVAALDTQKRELTTGDAGAYQVVAGQPYYVFNLLEELDQPGEWYLDRDSGMLYLYPPANIETAVVQVSMLETPVVQLEQVAHVTIRGLAFELGRSEGLTIRGGTDCLVAGCVLRRLGGTGIVIQGGSRHGVLGCDLHTLGRGGIVLSGGDRRTLTSSGHFIENCEIYDFSRVDRTYTPAVQADGVGFRIAHNAFHHSPCHAMRVEGNEHLIELNEIHHVVMESDDQGGLDMFMNPTYRGNIIRWNFWHDIGSGQACGQAGIRLDDAISGTLLYGNVFYRCAQANFGGVQIHGGKENIVDNNLFVECRNAISFSPWGADRWAKFLASKELVRETTATVDIRQPPYSTRYPELARLSEQADVNSIWRNVAVRCGGLLTRDGGIQDLRDNLATHRDPGFVDAAKLNFAIRPDSEVLTARGFRPIPMAEIGPYQDEWRATTGRR